MFSIPNFTTLKLIIRSLQQTDNILLYFSCHETQLILGIYWWRDIISYFPCLSWTNLATEHTEIQLILILLLYPRQTANKAYFPKYWSIPLRLLAGAGVLIAILTTFAITAFTSLSSWMLEFLKASSVAWLMSTISFSWKVVSIMSEHTYTDQQVRFWVTTAQWTQDTNWSWQIASGVLGSAKCGIAWEFLLRVSAYSEREREKRDIKKYRERKRKQVGVKWGKQISEADKNENAEKWETTILTITCCHTNPTGKFTVVPKKNTRCVNIMGNNKH